jgi:hypothetical protein
LAVAVSVDMLMLKGVWSSSLILILVRCKSSSIGNAWVVLRLGEDVLILSVLVVAQGWEVSLLYVFVDSALFTIGWMVSIAEDAFNMFRFFFSRTLLGEMIASALDTPGAMIAMCLGMPKCLAFTA